MAPYYLNNKNHNATVFRGWMTSTEQKIPSKTTKMWTQKKKLPFPSQISDLRRHHCWKFVSLRKDRGKFHVEKPSGLEPQKNKKPLKIGFR